jgi:ribosomal protein L20
LSAAIQTAIDQPEKTAQMGLAGHRKLKAGFTRELWINRISSVFEKVLQS